MSRSEKLTKFFGVYEHNLGAVDMERIVRAAAFVVIDAQRAFCDPEHEKKWGNEKTDLTAGNIGNLVPEFREAGIQVYHVYSYDFLGRKDKPEHCFGGFYKNTPAPEDELVWKGQESPFKERDGDFGSRLERAGHKIHLIAGFNASSCVTEYARDALASGHKVVILKDLIEDGEGRFFDKEQHLKIMEDAGAVVSDSGTVLSLLSQKCEP